MCEYEECVVDEFYKLNDKTMNQVNTSDVTMMTLAIADFVAAGNALHAHDFPVAIGLFVVGAFLVYVYHKIGS